MLLFSSVSEKDHPEGVYTPLECEELRRRFIRRASTLSTESSTSTGAAPSKVSHRFAYEKLLVRDTAISRRVNPKSAPLSAGACKYISGSL